MKNKGFTLIELLLVISIISLLSTVFFFNATEAKKNGEDASMKAQSKEVQKAIELYKLDNDGRVPGNTQGRMVREGSDEYATALSSLTPKYLSEIPTSPSGDSYAYMTNEDSTAGVFAANLNFEESNNENNNTSNKNSCSLVSGSQTNNEPSDNSFSSCTPKTGLTSCDQVNSIDQNTEICIDSYYTPGNTSIYDFVWNACSCNSYSNEAAWRNFSNLDILDSMCVEFAYYNPISPNASGNCDVDSNLSEVYVCKLNNPVESDSVCDGSSSSDYCTCL